MFDLVRDIRLAFRTLRRSWKISVVAVLSLALAIAGNTIVFSMINGVFYRPLPYHEADRLSFIGDRALDAPRGAISGMSVPNFVDLRERQNSYEDLAAMQIQPFVLQDGGETPETILGATVTSEFFPLFGVDVVRGRHFAAEEAVAGGERVIVVSHTFWSERLGNEEETATGLEPVTVPLNGQPHTIIGVLPADFDFLVPNLEVFTPLAIDPSAANRAQRSLLVFGRLGAGIGDEVAQIEMAALMERLIEEHPEANRGYTIDALNLRHEIPNRQNRILFAIIQGAMLFILLIACANLANLLLARSLARRREMAIRMSIGAGRLQIVRQLFTESGLMALAAGALSLLVSSQGVQIVNRMLSANLPGPYQPVMDVAVLLFTLGITLVGMFLFGFFPLLHLREFDTAGTLREGSAGLGGGRRQRRTSGVLVVAEVALALMALGGAGVLIRSFQVLQNTDPGFETANLLTFGLNLPAERYAEEEVIANAGEQLGERLAALPGVEGVILANARPRTPFVPQEYFTIDARPPEDPDSRPQVSRLMVTPGFFEILEIPHRSGRTFTGGDRLGTAPVIIINEAMAELYWTGEDPLGQHITILGESREIVGIVGTVRHGLAINTDLLPVLYLPWYQVPASGVNVALKTAMPPQALADAVRRQIYDFEAEAAIVQMLPLEDFMEQFFVAQNVIMGILFGFGAMGLLLAALGIYGVLAYRVTLQVREIGLRMAMGARRGRIIRGVTLNGLKMAGIGMAIGLPGAVAVTIIIGNLSQNAVPIQPVGLVAAAVVLMVVSVLATLAPAHRASRVDPVIALRME